MPKLKVEAPADLPPPRGAYSAALRCGDFVYVAEHASLGFPEMRTGLAPAAIMAYLGEYTLPRFAFPLVLFGDSITPQYALKIGLELYQFDADLSAERYAKRVRDDFRGGLRSGVNGTPTFFINGVRYNGDWAYENLLAALEAAAKSV